MENRRSDLTEAKTQSDMGMLVKALAQRVRLHGYATKKEACLLVNKPMDPLAEPRDWMMTTTTTSQDCVSEITVCIQTLQHKTPLFNISLLCVMSLGSLDCGNHNPFQGIRSLTTIWGSDGHPPHL